MATPGYTVVVVVVVVVVTHDDRCVGKLMGARYHVKNTTGYLVRVGSKTQRHRYSCVIELLAVRPRLRPWR